MARVTEVEETRRGGVRVEIQTGTGKAVHVLPTDQAIVLAQALDDTLDIKQQALDEVTA
jgi:hypothetical protein